MGNAKKPVSRVLTVFVRRRLHAFGEETKQKKNDDDDDNNNSKQPFGGLVVGPLRVVKRMRWTRVRGGGYGCTRLDNSSTYVYTNHGDVRPRLPRRRYGGSGGWPEGKDVSRDDDGDGDPFKGP